MCRPKNECPRKMFFQAVNKKYNFLHLASLFPPYVRSDQKNRKPFSNGNKKAAVELRKDSVSLKITRDQVGRSQTTLRRVVAFARDVVQLFRPSEWITTFS